MNGKSRFQAAAVLVVTVLLLGGLGLLSTKPSAAESKKIQGLVTKEGEPITLLEGVTVTLFDAHGQKGPLVTLTGPDGRYVFTPSPGFYYITVSKEGFFNNETTTFRFDGTKNLNRDIEMEEMPSAPFTLVVHVENPSGAAIVNASVELFDLSHEQVLEVALTNASGNASFAVWADTFELRVEKPTFNKSVVTVVVSGNTVETVTLYPGIALVGLARDFEDDFIEEGLVAYLYNVDGVEPAKRLLTASVTGSSYTFYAYPGNFILIVDADGWEANRTDINVAAAGRIDRRLRESPEERVDATFQYVQNNWNELTVWRNLTLNNDSTVPGLAYSFIRDLRLQIDLARGDGNGALDVAEIDSFRNWTLQAGPKYVDTQGLFTTNSKAYRSEVVNGTTDYGVQVDIPLPDGPATIVTWANYTVIDPSIPQNQKRYFLNVTAVHDEGGVVLVNRTFTASLVRSYERVQADIIAGNVEIRGYTRVVLDPAVATGSFDVRLVVEQSLGGKARAQVIGPTNRFTELNTSADNYTVIVPTEVNVTFSAEESTDPNNPDGRVSPDANFTWKFTNATTGETRMAYGITPDVNFTAMGNYSGNLTIEETGLNVTYTKLTVLVDGLPPIARIENNVTGLGLNANSTQIAIKEDAKIRFFAGNSTDMVHNELAGVIREYRWDMDGDGGVDATGRTVDWAFPEPGNFTVNLTVVDRAGHESLNATIWVVAEDVTPPLVEFEILTEEFEEAISVVEGKRYIFVGTGTTDNFDPLENMTFEWTFGDGNTTIGSNVTHVFENYGTYHVNLNVTDSTGNVGNASRQQVVEVDPSQRPDLQIVTNSLVVEPPSPEESSFFGRVTVTLSLNVTNEENRAAALNVQVSFWAFRFGEEPGSPLLITPEFYNADGTLSNNTLAPAETKTVKFTWVSPAQGNYTLRINVTDPREPDIFVGPRNSVQTQIDVRQAGWKTPLTIAAIVGIIAGIPTAIYLRRRYGARIRERITKR